jgi:hypothetical protein
MVEAIFQYRSLIGKCELGCGLTWEEIAQLTAMERALFVHSRSKIRTRVGLRGTVRGAGFDDRANITEIGVSGLVCTRAPWIECGELVELVIDIAERSYRFRAVSTALDYDGDDYRLELAFVGVPVCLHIAHRYAQAA